jgi:hypothetical protein
MMSGRYVGIGVRELALVTLLTKGLMEVTWTVHVRVTSLP